MSYADVEALPIVHLELPGALRGKIPRAEVVLWAGEGGAGKGSTLVWMAVATALQGHHAVVVFPEDDPETAVRPRLEAALYELAGSALAEDPGFQREVFSRIHDLTVSEQGAPFVLDATGKTPGGVPALRGLVDNPEGCQCPQDDPEHTHPVVRLVVIDPMLACTEGSVASNIGARRVLGPLQQLAKETGATVMLSQHTVVSSGKLKVAGSQGLLDTVRLCYMLSVDRYNAALRVVRVHKSNGARPGDVRFTLSTQPNGFKSVTWLDSDELAARRTAWRAAEGAPRRANPAGKVNAWLQASGGGTARECAEATGLDEAECAEYLRALEAERLAGVKRRPTWPHSR